MNPIVYEQLVDVRFADLDAYGHVNAPKYLEFVLASRFQYLQRTQGITGTQLVKKGLGFFLVRSEIEYRVAIAEVESVLVKSHVSEVNGRKLDVEFEMLSKDGATLHSRGKLFFIVIDMNTGKPSTLPEWAKTLFYA